MAELNSMQFVQKFIECLKEWRKQMSDTRDEKDAAYFFDAGLKKFILNHKDEFILLSTINCERGLMSFVKTWIFPKNN